MCGCFDNLYLLLKHKKPRPTCDVANIITNILSTITYRSVGYDQETILQQVFMYTNRKHTTKL